MGITDRHQIKTYSEVPVPLAWEGQSDVPGVHAGCVCASGCTAGCTLARIQGWVCTGCPVLRGTPHLALAHPGVRWEHTDRSLPVQRALGVGATSPVPSNRACPASTCRARRCPTGVLHVLGLWTHMLFRPAYPRGMYGRTGVPIAGYTCVCNCWCAWA